jgi:hypothetical protein
LPEERVQAGIEFAAQIRARLAELRTIEHEPKE